MKSALVVLCVASVAACATLSGYDPARYESTAPAPASADPETTPLPAARRSRMVDPRSPLHDGGP